MSFASTTAASGAACSTALSRQQGSKPVGNWLLQLTQSPVSEDRCLTMRSAEIAIVVDHDMRQPRNRLLQIVQRAWKPRRELFAGYVVAALRYPHRDALGRLLGTG